MRKALSLEELMDQWNSDSIINDSKLDHESLRQSSLHAKWLDLMTVYKMKAIALQSKISETKGLLARYYNGYMTKPELDELGRDQYRNKQPIKSELERLMDADPLLKDLNVKYDANLIHAEYCEQVVKAIRDRGFSIQTAVEYRKFAAGN